MSVFGQSWLHSLTTVAMSHRDWFHGFHLPWTSGNASEFDATELQARQRLVNDFTSSLKCMFEINVHVVEPALRWYGEEFEPDLRESIANLALTHRYGLQRTAVHSLERRMRNDLGKSEVSGFKQIESTFLTKHNRLAAMQRALDDLALSESTARAAIIADEFDTRLAAHRNLRHSTTIIRDQYFQLARYSQEIARTLMLAAVEMFEERIRSLAEKSLARCWNTMIAMHPLFIFPRRSNFAVSSLQLVGKHTQIAPSVAHLVKMRRRLGDDLLNSTHCRLSSPGRQLGKCSFRCPLCRAKCCLQQACRLTRLARMKSIGWQDSHRIRSMELTRFRTVAGPSRKLVRLVNCIRHGNVARAGLFHAHRRKIVRNQSAKKIQRCFRQCLLRQEAKSRVANLREGRVAVERKTLALERYLVRWQIALLVQSCLRSATQRLEAKRKIHHQFQQAARRIMRFLRFAYSRCVLTRRQQTYRFQQETHELGELRNHAATRIASMWRTVHAKRRFDKTRRMHRIALIHGENVEVQSRSALQIQSWIRERITKRRTTVAQSTIRLLRLTNEVDELRSYNATCIQRVFRGHKDRSHVRRMKIMMLQGKIADLQTQLAAVHVPRILSRANSQESAPAQPRLLSRLLGRSAAGSVPQSATPREFPNSSTSRRHRLVSAAMATQQEPVQHSGQHSTVAPSQSGGVWKKLSRAIKVASALGAPLRHTKPHPEHDFNETVPVVVSPAVEIPSFVRNEQPHTEDFRSIIGMVRDRIDRPGDSRVHQFPRGFVSRPSLHTTTNRAIIAIQDSNPRQRPKSADLLRSSQRDRSTSPYAEPLPRTSRPRSATSNRSGIHRVHKSLLSDANIADSNGANRGLVHRLVIKASERNPESFGTTTTQASSFRSKPSFADPAVSSSHASSMSADNVPSIAAAALRDAVMRQRRYRLAVGDRL